MIAKKRLLPALVTVLMVFAMMPITAGTAYASSGDPAMSLGTEVLGQDVNTTSAQTVWYAGNAWRVIGYDGEGADALKAQSDQVSSGNEWKVTVADKAHSGFAVSNVTAAENGVSVTYTGAKAGTDEYISAIITDKPITDKSAKITYYGRVKSCTAASDTVTINTAGKLGSGDTLYVFNEQCNGDKKTDYASALQEVTIQKPKLTITAKDQKYEYNGKIQGEGDTVYKDPAQIAEKVTVDGLQDGDSLTSIVVDGQGTDVGKYDLVPSGASVNGNPATDKYDVTYVPGKLTINPPQVSYDVTFKVVNGGWNDGSAEDKTVTLTGYEGDTLTLAAEDIPAVGEKPDPDYKAGTWDVTPDTVSAITQNMTYTYTYEKRAPAVVTKAPEAGALTYNASLQKLVTAGEASGGTMYYAIGTDSNTAPSEDWSVDIPEQTYAGTYYVWYKVKGDQEHTDSDVKCVTAAIGQAEMTIKAASQNWIYDGAEHSNHEVTLSSGQLFGGDTLVAAAAGSVTDVADTAAENNPIESGYKVMHGNKDVTDNYAITPVAGTLSISVRPAFVKAVDQTIKEGESIKEGVDMAILTDAVEGHALSAVTLTAQDEKIVSSAAEVQDAAGGNVTENYSITYQPGTLTIIPKVSGTLLARMTAKGRTSLCISWNKIKGAEGYDIFFIKCGKDAPEKVKTIKGNETFKWTKKKLKAKEAYQTVVKAYVMKNGKKSYVRTSPLVHAYTSGATKNYTNPKSVTVKKSSVSLKTGKTYKIRASVTKLKKGKKLMPSGHAPKLRYLSSNKKVAAVSKSGRITAKGKGICKIYVYAANGVYKTVKVTVH